VDTRRIVAFLAAAAVVISGLVALAVPASATSVAAAPPGAATIERSLRAAAGAGLTLRRAADGVVHQLGTATGRPVPRAAGVTVGGDAAARGFLATYGPLFGLRDQASELRVERSTVLAAGQHATRFAQLADGLPVLGGELVVVTDRAGNVLSTGGETARSVHPAEALVTAVTAAATAIRATAKGHRTTANRLTAGTPKLIGFDPSLLGAPGRPGSSPVWQVEVRGTAVRDQVMVDAARGAIVLHYNQLAEATNRLVCDFANTPVNDTTSPPGYACGTANATRAEGDPPSTVSDADAAYDNAGHTADFYQSTVNVDLTALIGSNAGDATGTALRSSSRVCLGLRTCPYPNAFWDGTQMVYGEGYPAAEDAVAHEMTHGVTERISGLAYLYQSGAINESMSDVFGELVDQNDGVNAPDSASSWLLGEDLPGGAIRSMSDPTDFSQPDRMTSPFYTADANFSDNGGVHTNSGVGNKAAYLIAHGGTFNGHTVAGIGVFPTANIYFRVQQLLSTGADYADLAATLPVACQQVSVSLGFVDQCAQVQAAVDAVEMSAQPTVPGAAAPEAPYCAAGKTQRTLFSDNMESSGNWSSPASWTYTDGYATSGHRSLYGFTPDTAPPPSVYGGSVQAVPLYVSAGPTTYVRFTHYDEFDSFQGVNYDGGQVQYSTNSGSSWLDAGALPTDNGYNSTITPNATTSFAGFGGVSSGYVSSRINVTSLGGHSVLFRFRILGDGGVASSWLVDDFALYQCGYPSVVTLTRSAPAALYGYGVTVSGTLRYLVGGAPVPPVTVSLAYRKAGTMVWVALGSTMSTVSGTYSFAVKPAFNTEYQSRFAGSTSFLPATSSGVIVNSVPVVAAAATPATVPHGTYTHINVSVRPNHAAQRVTLQRLVGTTWTWMAYGTLDAASAVTFAVRPLTAGTYTYRVYKTADSDHLVGISANVTVRAT
jgi:bacillolysin